jgi:hypothetical protein
MASARARSTVATAAPTDEDRVQAALALVDELMCQSVLSEAVARAVFARLGEFIRDQPELLKLARQELRRPGGRPVKWTVGRHVQLLMEYASLEPHNEFEVSAAQREVATLHGVDVEEIVEQLGRARTLVNTRGMAHYFSDVDRWVLEGDVKPRN